jgi:hypothetical protein
MTRAGNKLMIRLVIAGWSCAVTAGCGSSERSPFERFERLPTIEELVAVDLGEYVVSVPIEVRTAAGPVAPTQMQIEFFLHAAVLPKYEKTVRANFERLEGRLRDKVIETCRNTQVEDLLDPQLTILKVHLADSLKPYIGDARIERIHIADPQIKRL